MRVLLDTAVVERRELKVDDVHDVANVDAASADTRGNQNGGLASAEGAHGGLTVLLRALTMDGNDREAGVPKVVIEAVDLVAAVGKNDGAHASHLLEKLEKKSTLLGTVSLNDTLLNVTSRAAGAANTEADVRLSKVLASQVAGLLGEGGREQAELDRALVLFCKGVRRESGQVRWGITYRLHEEWAPSRPPSHSRASRRPHR